MRKHVFIIIAILAACAGCGQGYDSSAEEAASSISLMEIKLSREQVTAGMTVQLTVDVTLNTAETVEGLTTEFEDPVTGDKIPIEWSTSDNGVAVVDGLARLIAKTSGFVTLRATIGETVRMRTVRVDMVPSTSVAAPDESVDDGGASSTEPAGESSSCRGHALSVVSFLPGAGAGFGGASFPDIVLGAPKGGGSSRGSVDVLSLGRNGEIVLDLGDCAVVDGPGVDLIVFENAFWIGGDPEDPYAELGIVGVGEDGVHFTDFDCNEDGFPYSGCAGWNPVYSSPSNGISPFDVENAGGDPFDLAEIGVESARYVRIRDAGTEGFGTSIGFDLDAISVINGELR